MRVRVRRHGVEVLEVRARRPAARRRTGRGPRPSVERLLANRKSYRTPSEGEFGYMGVRVRRSLPRCPAAGVRTRRRRVCHMPQTRTECMSRTTHDRCPQCRTRWPHGHDQEYRSADRPAVDSGAVPARRGMRNRAARTRHRRRRPFARRGGRAEQAERAGGLPLSRRKPQHGSGAHRRYVGTRHAPFRPLRRKPRLSGPAAPPRPAPLRRNRRRQADQERARTPAHAQRHQRGQHPPRTHRSRLPRREGGVLRR
ncbi:hypothetical protein GZL_06237 [Streptomyces sp. 769]|nr:hypothetical protein GZL_06237 [Streptomyces sp. 769]